MVPHQSSFCLIWHSYSHVTGLPTALVVVEWNPEKCHDAHWDCNINIFVRSLAAVTKPD